ncbi:AAA family ATPase [Gracilibacillus sp. YIM 98692]|uniref:ATP-dependent nuclease n=1 Tax=Gracilibacillus sp. YIM 98692 TaxID=2663532 RepID=UPI0013D625F7|nr:AAA family ATPase [Gracilibacillus sp. YIM 98692]
MNVLDCVIVNKHKGIEENIEISILGKINVICGKNNSGKTVILSALEQDEHCIIGLSVSEEKLYQIVQEENLSNAPQGVVQNQLDQLNKELKKLQKNTWLIEDIDDVLVPSINQHCPSINDTTKLRNILVSQLNDMEKSKRVFIPSKRKIHESFDLQYEAQFEPSGPGVLNRLFDFKNQLDSTEAKQRYIRIKEQFNYITSGYNFEITINHRNINLYFTNDKGDWIGSEDSGMGLKDLLIILFFMNLPDLDVILIDEVETHMHPDMQRKLLYVMSKESNKQYFLSTHSNVFLDITMVDRIFHSYFDHEKGIQVHNATSRSTVLNDIGFSVADNLISDLIILTEGPTDKPILEEFLNKMGLFKYNIKTWPLGGDAMDQVDLSVFKDAYKIMALIDSDPDSHKVRNRFKKQCDENEIYVYQLKRYAIENYFTVNALKKIYGRQIPEDFELNSGEKLEKQLFNVKKKNRHIAKHMMLEEIKGTDLYDFLTQVENYLTQEFSPS